MVTVAVVAPTATGLVIVIVIPTGMFAAAGGAMVTAPANVAMRVIVSVEVTVDPAAVMNAAGATVMAVLPVAPDVTVNWMV